MTVGGVDVTVASEHRVDVTLRPGKIESRVEVEASGTPGCHHRRYLGWNPRNPLRWPTCR